MQYQYSPSLYFRVNEAWFLKNDCVHPDTFLGLLIQWFKNCCSFLSIDYKARFSLSFIKLKQKRFILCDYSCASLYYVGTFCGKIDAITLSTINTTWVPNEVTVKVNITNVVFLYLIICCGFPCCFWCFSCCICFDPFLSFLLFLLSFCGPAD